MSTTVADEECLEAIKKFWDQTAGLYDLFGALRTGRLILTPALPYVTALSEKSKEQEWHAPVQKNSSYSDFRRLTLKGWGSRAQIITMAKNIFDLMAWLPRDNVWLEFPSGVAFVRLMPLDDPHLEEDPTTKDGKDVWTCTAIFELWTVRTLGGVA